MNSNDETGATLIHLSGVKCQALPSDQPTDPLADLFYQMTWVAIEEPEVQTPSPEPWLVIGGSTPAAKTCIQQFETLGLEANHLPSIEQARDRFAEYEHIKQIVVLATLKDVDDQKRFDGESTLDYFASITSMLKEIVSRNLEERVDIHFVTQNAFQIEPEDRNTNLDTATLNALGVLVENEHLNIHCHFTDVTNPADFETNMDSILFPESPIRERAIRGNQWYRQVLEPTHIEPPQPPVVSASVHETTVGLRQVEAGNVDSLTLHEIELPAPGPNEVQIKVHSCSLNFKDVLKVYGQIDAATLEDTYCGDTLGVDPKRPPSLASDPASANFKWVIKWPHFLPILFGASSTLPRTT